MKKKCLLTAFLVGCSMSMSFAHGMLQEAVTDIPARAVPHDDGEGNFNPPTCLLLCRQAIRPLC